jgi:predicted GIY-YIG superfamily endonuclease
MYSIYALYSNSDSNNIRYIGYTKKSLKIRLKEHISESILLKSHKHKWIQKHLNQNSKIEIKLLENVSSIFEAKNREIELIKIYKELGFKLVNGTNGGDGIVGLKQSEEQKRLNGLRKAKPVYYFTYKSKELLGCFSSCTEAVVVLSLTKSLFGKVLSGKSNHHKGYTFSFLPKFPERICQKRTSWNKGLKTKNLQKFNTKRVKVKKDENENTFESVNEVSSFLKMNKSLIFRYIKSGKLYKGWKIEKVL